MYIFLFRCRPVKLFHHLYVPIQHDPELSPIIFLHGAAASHSTWSRVNTYIAEKTKRKVRIYIIHIFFFHEFEKF